MVAAVELIGAELDAAVARALGDELRLVDGQWMAKGNRSVPWYYIAKYSTDWSQGGPIIERERIVTFRYEDEWLAVVDPDNFYGQCLEIGFGSDTAAGPTPLIAAMRAFVASKA